MIIAIASDHAGYVYKALIASYLEKKGHCVKDFGCEDSQSVHYPVYGKKAAKAVASGECEKGILICGSGAGMSLAANKTPGIRCVLCSEPYTARISRMHNDSNMLAFGARVIGIDLAYEIVDAWLSAEFEGGRHQERIDMLE